MLAETSDGETQDDADAAFFKGVLDEMQDAGRPDITRTVSINGWLFTFMISLEMAGAVVEPIVPPVMLLLAGPVV